eukprot:COSAG01_NODE_1286_length_10900_cov_26.719100_9_plen_100_part_00
MKNHPKLTIYEVFSQYMPIFSHVFSVCNHQYLDRYLALWLPISDIDRRSHLSLTTRSLPLTVDPKGEQERPTMQKDDRQAAASKGAKTTKEAGHLSLED